MLQDGKAPQKKKKKELVNLYPWQQRETQRQQIAELRQKFEEDKRRVAEMKARRKFKPF
jgi:ribosomal RNA-processing protein 7